MKKKTVTEAAPISYEKIKANTIMTKEQLKKAGWKETKQTLGVCQVWKLNGTDLFWNAKTKTVAGTRDRKK